MPLDLTRIRALADAASEGPWLPDRYEPDHRIVNEHGIDIAANYDYEAGGICEPEDLAFICAARSLIPDMCDEIEQLRQRIAELERGANHIALPRTAKPRCSSSVDDEVGVWRVCKLPPGHTGHHMSGDKWWHNTDGAGEAVKAT